MSATHLDQGQIEALRALDTPTVCNAIELLRPERRGFGFSDEALVCADPALPPVVGYAKTATIRSLEPGDKQGPELRAHRLAYYGYLTRAPGPAVVVIQDLDGARAGYGAFWGEVQSNLHKALGCAGAITDGSMRDVDDLAPGFQILARKLVPSHAYVHLVAFDCEVRVLGMRVRPGDLVHADRHGAVVIPGEAAPGVAGAAGLVQRRERVILDASRAPDFGLERLEQALIESEGVR